MSNGTQPSYQRAESSAMRERVENIGQRQLESEHRMNEGFNQVNASIGNLANEFRTTLASVVQEFRTQQRPPFQAYSIIVTITIFILGAFGSLAYWPISSSLADVKGMLREVGSSMTPLQTFNDFRAQSDGNRLAGRQEYNDKIARVEGEVRELRTQMVPRGEHEEKWRAYAAAHADHQRQIDEMKKAFGDTYGLRDALMDLRQRLDVMEGKKGG